MRVILSVIFRRLTELLLPVIIFSAGVSLLDMKETISSSQSSYGTVLLFLTILYFMYNGYLLDGCYDDLYRHEYYTSNILAILVFTLITSGFYFFGDPSLFKWLFSMTRCLSFVSARTSEYGSIILFSLTLLIMTLCVPKITHPREKKKKRNH